MIIISIFIVTILAYNQFLEGTENLWIVIGCIMLFCIILLVLIIGTIPFLKDIKLIKMKKFERITGEVVKYRKVVHGGDPTTYGYYPTIRDLSKKWMEVEVEGDNTELNKIYHCIYLPNTKFAVFEEMKNSEENI